VYNVHNNIQHSIWLLPPRILHVLPQFVSHLRLGVVGVDEWVQQLLAGDGTTVAAGKQLVNGQLL